MHTNCMAEKYWFKKSRNGYGREPATWQGWVIMLLYFSVTIFSFVTIYSPQKSVEQIAWEFLPRVLIFSALLIIATYLKGEPRK
jgi:hypothetical protein